MLRKINDKIFLDVYKLKSMNLIDECLFKTSSEVTSYTSNEVFIRNIEQPFGFAFVKINSDGEAYIRLYKHGCHITNKDNKDRYEYEYRFDIDENYIKLAVSLYIARLKSFSLKKLDMPGDSDSDYFSVNATYKKRDIDKKIETLSTILNWWNEKHDDNVSDVIGARLDPFAEKMFKSAWASYDYMIDNVIRNEDCISEVEDEMKKYL